MKHISCFLPCLIVAVALTFSSCVSDEDFLVRPVSCNEPNLVAKLEVNELKALALASPYKLTQDEIVKAYVVSSDAAGNFFKTLSLVSKDGEYGFSLEVDREALHTFFEPGREIYLKIKGLQIGQDNDGVSLGLLYNGAIGRLPAAISDNFLVRGCNTVSVDKLVQKIIIPEVSNSRIEQLIEIDSVQFSALSEGTTYYDPKRAAGSGTNQIIEDKQGNTIIVRISEFADFAGKKVPSYMCKIRGVLQKFGSDFQLLIRDESDIKRIADRAVWGFSDQEIEGEKRTIKAVRDSFVAGITNLVIPSYVEGVVTLSPTSTNNVVSRNAFIQDESAGILLRSNQDTRLLEGYKVRVQLHNATLATYRGLLQIDDLRQDRDVQVLETSVAAPAPRKVSIQDIIDGKYEAEIVEIDAVQFIETPSLFSGSNLITDGKQTLAVYTQSGASFASTPVPSGNGPIVGVASVFDDRQLILISVDGASRLTGTPLNISSQTTFLSIADLRARTEGDISDNVKIKGVVTSDYTKKNMQENNLFLQDATAGIMVRFTTPHAFALGEELEIRLQGKPLDKFAELLQVNNLEISSAKLLASGKSVTPTTVTMADLLAGKHEGILVKIEGVQFVQSGTYVDGGTSRNLDVQLCSTGEKITTFIRSVATFGSSTIPQGSGSVVAVASKYNTPQLYLRNTSDVQLTAPRGTSCSTTPTPHSGGGTILITEIADPNNSASSRFVELYNAGSSAVSLGGWSIRRYTNGSSTATNVYTIPSGVSIAAGGFYVVANNESEFTSRFSGVVADAYTGSVSMNGDDGVLLVNASGETVDIYGVVGEDGTAKAWEYEDGGAFRNVSVTSPSATFNIGEWTIYSDASGSTPLDAPSGFTPRDRSVPVVTVPPPTLETEETISSLRRRSQGNISDNIRIRGVVTSDRTSRNINERNLFLQQGDAGIQLRFTSAHTFSLGDSISINIQNTNLSTFNGLLQVDGALVSSATVHAPSVSVTPVRVTIADLLGGSYQGRLVQLSDVQFKESGMYVQGVSNTTLTIEVCPGGEELSTYIFSSATFGGNTIDTDKGTLIGVATTSGTHQLYIRNEGDISLKSARGVCTTAPPSGPVQVLITEIADPNNSASSRFVELYNAGSSVVSLGGWSIRRYTNGSSTATNVYTIPSGVSIAAGGFYVVANNESEFTSRFSGVVADAYTGSVSMNGDDGVLLVNASGETVDIYGVVGEDGTAKAWEYEDGGAFRNVSVTSPSETFNIGEWTIYSDASGSTPLDAPSGFTPRDRALPSIP